MSEILEYKCPNCGGSMEFDTETQKMKCPFCDSIFDVSDLQQKDEGLDAQKPDSFEWNTAQTQEWSDEDADGMSVFVCKSCGGEIVGDNTTAATFCPYCGNPVVMTGRLAGALKPNYVIPFKLDKNAAKKKLREYIAKKRFAPSTFKSENKLDEIKGVYVPFWLFDSDTAAAVSFEGTQVRTWSDSQYNYTETSHFDVFRSGVMRFENIPVDGSEKMPDDLMESIEPFDFKEAAPFQTAYLSGFFADKYDVPMEQSIERANARVKVSAENTLRTTAVGYTTLTPKFTSVQVQNGLAKYALYPVWLLNTSYKGEKYTFAMNGQTGKFIGNLPVDKRKLAALFSGLSVGVSAIVFLLGLLAYWL